jgi:hypothetical protein
MARRRRVNRNLKPLPLAPFKQDGSRAPQHRRAKGDAYPFSGGRNRLSAVQQTYGDEARSALIRWRSRTSGASAARYGLSTISRHICAKFN